MLQKMVDRYTKYPLVSQQLKDFLQVELDIGPLLSCRTSLGPSPLSNTSSSSCPASANSCITIAAAGEMGKGQGYGSLQWKMMRQRAEDALWLASAFFILFYGDFRSNFFSLLASDPRIPRAPLVYGMACMLMNCIILVLFCMTHPQLKRSPLKKQEEYISAAASSVFTLLGLAAFVMLSIALWPVWYILTLPLLFTLFMAMVVVSSYALPWSSVLDANKDIWSLASKA